jgi:hypothetical protein
MPEEHLLDHTEDLSIKSSLGSKPSLIQRIKDRLAKKPRITKKRVIFSVLILLLVILSAVVSYTVFIGLDLKAQAQIIQAKGQQTYILFKEQNLPEANKRLDEIDQDFQIFKTTYHKLSFYKYLPVSRNYYNDGLHGLNAGQAGINAAKKSVEAITPYSDILGLEGEASFEGGTTEDRVKVILETLDKITPILDEITADLKVLESELAKINPQRYPDSVGNFRLRDNIILAQNFSSQAYDGLVEFRPVLEELPGIAGARGERKKYLVLFQNNNELRPTGGFLTAYAIINIEDGKVEAERSDDIYALDQKFNRRIPIPSELGRYLTTERFWNLRDMNISPDFKTSMDQFYEHYQTVPGEPSDLDGIIAVDTHFLTNLMDVLGPTEVPGYGTFSAENDPRCDCPQIIYILSEIITRPTPYLRENRKGILGPLMQALLSKAYAAPKTDWPDLFSTGFRSIQNKHVQLYFMDEDAQRAAEIVQVAGRMTAPEDGSDFLAIINANLGGAKSNLFTEYEVKQTISEPPTNGMLEKTVEISYRNTRKADNCDLEAGQLCLNSTLRDWIRIYIPKGSELIEAQGFLEEVNVYEENGFTIIDGFFILEPLGLARLSLKYKIPYEDNSDYKINIWKQGGINFYPFTMDITGGQEKVEVFKDTVYETYF